MSDVEKKTKSQPEMMNVDISKNTPIVVFLHVISSPTRILGAIFVGFIALLFGVFVYPGNERLQNIVYKKLEEPAATVKVKESETPSPAVVAAKAPAAAPLAPVPSPPVAAAISAPAPVVPAPSPPLALAAPPSPPAAVAGPSIGTSAAEAVFADLKLAVKALSPRRTDEYVTKLSSEYAALTEHSALASTLTDRGFFRVGDIGRGADRAQELTLERCQIYFGESCLLVALDSNVVLPLNQKKWTPMGTPRLAYSGKFRVDMVPGMRIDQIGVLEIYGRESTGARAIVIDTRGGAHPGRDDVLDKAAESKAFAACKTANAGRDAVCVLYAVNDRVVLGQRVIAPR